MKKFFFKIKLAIYNQRVFYFLFGLLVASTVYFYTENQYEKEIFVALKKFTLSKIDTNQQHNIDSILVAATATTHELEKSRQTMFAQLDGKSLKSKYLQPITYDLMTGQGACGSNSYVLGRLLREFGIDVKFAQMYVNGSPGGHIVIEANKDTTWVVLDALYNQYFVDSLGKFASFATVGKNWDYYKKQINEGYDEKYKYEKVQYTNWDKIPIILPFIRKVLVLIKGEDFVQTVSLRNILLQKFRFLYYFTLSILIFILVKRSINFYKIKKVN